MYYVKILLFKVTLELVLMEHASMLMNVFNKLQNAEKILTAWTQRALTFVTAGQATNKMKTFVKTLMNARLEMNAARSVCIRTAVPHYFVCLLFVLCILFPI